MFRSFEFAVNERLVNHNLGCDVPEFTPLPRLELPSPRLEVALHSVDPTEMQSMSENDLECFARTGVNTPAMAKMTDDGPPGSYPKADTGSIGGFRPARREVVPKSAWGKCDSTDCGLSSKVPEARLSVLISKGRLDPRSMSE